MVTLRDLPDVWIAQPGGGMAQPTAGPYLDIEPDDDTEPTVMPQDVVALLGFDPLQEPIEEDSPSAGVPHVPPINPMTHDAGEFAEAKHPRGQPGNAGQFASGSGGGGKQVSKPHITHAVAREMAKAPKKHSSEDLVYALSQLKPSAHNKMDRAHRKSIVAELANRGIKLSKSKAEGTEPPADKQIPAALKEQVKAAEPVKEEDIDIFGDKPVSKELPPPPEGISENVTKILQKADVDKLKNILKAQGADTPVGHYAKALLAHYGNPAKEGVDLGSQSSGKPEIGTLGQGSPAIKKVQDIGEGGLSDDQKVKILKQMLENYNNSYNTEQHIESWIAYLEGKDQAPEPEAQTGGQSEALANFTKATYSSVNNMTAEQLTQYLALATTENVHFSPLADFAKQKLKEKGGQQTPSAPAKLPEQPTTPAPKTDGPWNKITGKLGSNEGGKYEVPGVAGAYVYAKIAQTKEHADNERLAQKLYHKLGVFTPTITIRKADLFGGNADQVATTTAWDDNLKSADLDNSQVKMAIQKNFVAHAWLANWDAVASGNQGWTAGTPSTTDVGGALMFRAKGAPKGMAFGDDVTEWDSMRKGNKNPAAVDVFGSMTNEQLIESAKPVLAMGDEEIENLVEAYGPGTEEAKKTLAKKLMARRDDIKAKVKALSEQPKVPVTAANVVIPTQTSPAPTKHYEGHDDFVKQTGLGTSMTAYRAKLPIQTKEALQAYSGSVYKEINRNLRDQEVLPEYQQNIVDGIDDFLESDAAKLPKEVEVWRGAKLPPQQIQSLAAALQNPGKKLTLYNHGFSSTSWEKSVAENFCGNETNSVMMRVTVRKGAKVAYMGEGISNLSHEKEMLLPRSVPFRVTKVYKNSYGRYTIEATVR
jgi:hypothetical protein